GAIPTQLVGDPLELNMPGLGLGRDGSRTPMQWDASDGAGFTTGKPWLPLAEGREHVNVESERNERSSLYFLHRQLLRLRRTHSALAIGHYRPMAATGDLLLYQR